MFSILVNTCAIPDGIVSYSATSKCSQCQRYAQTVYYTSCNSTDLISSSQPPMVKNEPSSTGLSTYGLPDIVVSHPSTSGLQYIGAENVTSHSSAADQQVTHSRRRSSSSRRRGGQEMDIDQHKIRSRRHSDTISRSQSSCRRRDSRSTPGETSGSNPRYLESTCLESCYSDSSALPPDNRIDYVSFGCKLRLIADNFQSKQHNGMVTSETISWSCPDDLPQNCAKYFGIGLLGVLVLHMIRAAT